MPPCHAGEKWLKSLLSKTRQWRSPAERAVAAAACDATGYENLARVLRNDVTSAALRKRDMIALARHWGYRSHIWRCAAWNSPCLAVALSGVFEGWFTGNFCLLFFVFFLFFVAGWFVGNMQGMDRMLRVMKPVRSNKVI